MGHGTRFCDKACKISIQNCKYIFYNTCGAIDAVDTVFIFYLEVGFV